jgi:hypothetical protein
MTVATKTRLTRVIHWPAERVVVALIALLWLLLLSPVPRSLDGTGMIIGLILLALDIVLGILTGGLALAPTRMLDERLTAARDRAYRSAFGWMRSTVIVMLVLAAVSSGVNALQGTGGPAGVSLRFLLAFVEMVVVLPTAVLAWEQTALPTAADRGSVAPRRWLALLLLPLLAIAWGVVAPILPVRTVVARPTNIVFDMAGATCTQFLVEKEIAAGLGGAVGFHAEVCWNGKHAFAVGDPSLPLPTGVLPEQDVMPPGGLSEPDLTACVPGNAETDFAAVSQTCTEQIDGAGTMTLIARGRVSPLPRGFGARQLELRLVVDRNGKLLGVE